MMDVFNKVNFYTKMGMAYEFLQKNDVLDKNVVKVKDIMSSKTSEKQ